MKVCIIDDVASNTGVLGKFLKMKGHESVITNSGKEGFSLLENEIFDVTVLDVDMPEMSGIDIVNSLHESGRIKEQKIVIFSASNPDEKTINELKEKGVIDFLKKPMDLSELIVKLEKIVKSD